MSRTRIYRGLAASFLLAALTSLDAQQEPYIHHSERHRQTAALEADAAALNPSVQGKWTTLGVTMPINPVHLVLMHTGRVLVVAGSGNRDDNRSFMAAFWDPALHTVETFPLDWDMFCNGMVTLPDGRPMIFGGTISYDGPGVNFKGEPRASRFMPALNRFNDLPRMRRGRWYPTGTVLGNGNVFVIAGLDEQGVATSDVEIYRPATNDWVLGTRAPWVPPLYPRQHLLPSGKVFISGSHPRSRFYDPATGVWTLGPMTLWRDATRALNRDYGTSVLLPLTPANGFKPAVMILGGGHHGGPFTATTEKIDLSAANPVWTPGPSMKQARVQLNATILPNGKLLVSGGQSGADRSTAVTTTQLYDPATNTFSDGAPMQFARLYHSNTLLQPDGTVLAVGSNPTRDSLEHHIEVYSPPYLFTSTGAPAPRPTITSAPRVVAYGSTIQVQTPNAAAIRSAVLIRLGAPTHAFDMEQRLVGMTFTAGSGVLNVTAPANRNLAPPGYYLFFILNANGVPSVGSFMRME